MSDVSVAEVRVPRLRNASRVNDLAKRTLLKLLQRVEHGSLTLHDGDDTSVFGDVQAASGPHAVIHVQDPQAYRYVLTGGNVGAGEAYMQGFWSSPELTEVIRSFSANLTVLQNMDARKSLRRWLGLKFMHVMNGNSLRGSKRNISAHYDLGNDFFELFLDPTMMYSAAVFPDAEASLDTAAVHKLELICQQLDLQPGDHVMEIGTGWGGMALHAAQRYGCRVTTTTLSRQQHDFTVERVRAAGLEAQVTVLLKDYRELEGQYDKLVSIEMIEAVGHDYYQSYFQKCSELLKPDGLMVIQAITVADQRYALARDAVDFIKRYIFPGGCLPSIEVISRHVARDTDMQITHLRDITDDYARTLACWRERFMASLAGVRDQGFDETFERMWEYYLCYCEGGFRERIISTVQVGFAKPGFRVSR